MRSLIGSALERRGANPYTPWGDTQPPTNGMLGSPVAGTVVTEKSSLQVAAVYGSVSLLAGVVATTPLRQFRGKSSRDPNKVEVDLSPVIADPFIELSDLDWRSQAEYSLSLRGNFYGRIIARDRKLYPLQVKPYHPDQIRVRRLSDGPNKGTIEYRFHDEIVPVDDVVHVRGLTPPGSVVGLNPIEVCRNSFGNMRAADLYSGAFFQNSALAGGVIETDYDLNEEETLELARGWMMTHQGIGQAHLPAVLTGGAKFNAISITPEDAQFLETRQYSAGEISGIIFRIPPHMLGIVDRTTSWGTGIEQQELGFVRNTMLEKLRRYEIALSSLVPIGQFVMFDLAHRLRGDTLQRAQAHMLERQMGTMTIDEIRLEEDRAPFDEPWSGVAPPTPLASNTGGLAPTSNPDAPDAGAQKSPGGGQ